MSAVDFYNRYYDVVERSAAHAAFCARVYGKNLCQHGMADMPQIDTLIRLLDLKPGDRLLDAGCGSGRITEYIQATTGAFVTGIDISSVAIERATQRTQAASDRLVFRVGDMCSLAYPPGSFEAAVLIDSHYFTDDLEGLLDGVIRILTHRGQIGLFSDQGTGVPGRDDSSLQASESLIGLMLARKGIPYRAVNLTRQNREHWRCKERVLRVLRPQFEAEGSLFLYENRLNECTSSNRDLDARFLFHIKNQG